MEHTPPPRKVTTDKINKELKKLLDIWKSREQEYRKASAVTWDDDDKLDSRRYEGEAIATRWAIEDLTVLLSKLDQS